MVTEGLLPPSWSFFRARTTVSDLVGHRPN